MIKIDRVFVDMIKPTAPQPVPVLDGLISMARDLGTEIVAEGVETEARRRALSARPRRGERPGLPCSPSAAGRRLGGA